MKMFLRLVLLITLFFQGQVFAKSFNVLVLPSDLLEARENYYAFEEVSEIVSSDIILNFSKTPQIITPDLYSVRERLSMNSNLKTLTLNTLKKYKNSGTIDYTAFKKISNDFKCNSVLIVSSYAVTSHNSLKRSLWDVLDVSSAYSIAYPYMLETNAVLLDTVNDLVMWSGSYSKKAVNNENVFTAKNYAEANAHLENIRMYSKDILAKDITQNVTLRFFPKSIRPVDKKTPEGDAGGTLRYERTIPVITRPDKNAPELGKDHYGEMIFGI